MAHILLIDDDADVRTILERLLSRRWPLTQTAENGQAGIKLLTSLRYDVVITDIVMPEQDGYEVISEIGRVSPHTKVIAMTGGSTLLGRDQLLEVARAMKADRVFTKPFNFKLLEQAVTELLE